MHHMHRRQLLPRRLIRAAAVPVGVLLEYAWARTGQQLHSLSCRLVVRHRLDSADAVRTGHEQRK